VIYSKYIFDHTLIEDLCKNSNQRYISEYKQLLNETIKLVLKKDVDELDVIDEIFDLILYGSTNPDIELSNFILKVKALSVEIDGYWKKKETTDLLNDEFCPTIFGYASIIISCVDSIKGGIKATEFENETTKLLKLSKAIGTLEQFDITLDAIFRGDTGYYKSVVNQKKAQENKKNDFRTSIDTWAIKIWKKYPSAAPATIAKVIHNELQLMFESFYEINCQRFISLKFFDVHKAKSDDFGVVIEGEAEQSHRYKFAPHPTLKTKVCIPVKLPNADAIRMQIIKIAPVKSQNPIDKAPRNESSGNMKKPKIRKRSNDELKKLYRELISPCIQCKDISCPCNTKN
jgi:hypothetical protein